MSIADEKLLREIAPGAWAIRLPIPWPPGGVTSYLFRGEDGYFLIDCGLNTDETFEAFDGAFRRIGIDWRAVTKILISHLHPDHVGGAARARRLSGAHASARVASGRAAHRRSVFRRDAQVLEGARRGAGDD